MGVAALLFFSACNTTKYLNTEEAFLDENLIDIKTDQQIKKKGNLKYELSTLYKQRPNTNFLFVPREWFYYQVQDTLGQTKIRKGFKRWMMRQFGEEPVLYDPSLTESTERSMEYFLQHKGYFLAKVQSFYEYTDRQNKKIKISYEVRPNRQYLIDTVQFISRDSNIHRILQTLGKTTLLKKGSPVDVTLYEQESSRIVSFLKNEGYAYFTPNYVASLEADSSDYTARLKLEVLLPANDSIHRTYTIGDLYIYPTYDPANPIPSQIDTLAEGIYLVRDSSELLIREKVLIGSIYLKKGELFRQENYDRTNRQLSNLGVFRFVTIKGEPDPNEAGKINFRIFLTPNKRYAFGSDLEVNFNTSSSPLVPRQLLGVSGNLSYRHRNLLKGAELFITNLEGGVDLNVTNFDRPDSLINTLDLRIQSDLYLPKFVDFFNFYKLLDRMRIIRRPFYHAMLDKGATRFSLSYNYLERFDLFILNTFNTAFGYDFTPSSRHRYVINHFGVDFLSPKVFPLFEDLILKGNGILRQTFDTTQIFTGFLLRDFNYTYTGLSNRFGESSSFITRLELSGLEVFAVNALYNGLVAPDKRTTFTLPLGQERAQFFQFARFEFDFRHYWRMSKNQFFVLRAAIGLAAPFGYSTSVPYVKQFSAGGPQSVRAWNAREIGPGGFRDSLSRNPGTNPTLFYQAGEFKLDFNAEYRFPIFTLFGIKYEGALFLDAGNIWTTYKDTDKALARLRWTPLYNEDNQKIADNLFRYIAVGTGFGLRLDFSYFLFRLDVGMKLRNPFPVTDENNVILEETFWRSPFQNGIRDLNLNIGLGYPF